jgi:hypothetical protein
MAGARAPRSQSPGPGVHEPPVQSDRAAAAGAAQRVPALDKLSFAPPPPGVRQAFEENPFRLAHPARPPRSLSAVAVAWRAEWQTPRCRSPLRVCGSRRPPHLTGIEHHRDLMQTAVCECQSMRLASGAGRVRASSTVQMGLSRTALSTSTRLLGWSDRQAKRVNRSCGAPERAEPPARCNIYLTRGAQVAGPAPVQVGDSRWPVTAGWPARRRQDLRRRD